MPIAVVTAALLMAASATGKSGTEYERSKHSETENVWIRSGFTADGPGGLEFHANGSNFAQYN